MVNGDGGIEEWEATSETTELQEIPGLEGLETSQMVVMGVYGAGDYLGILEASARTAPAFEHRPGLWFGSFLIYARKIMPPYIVKL